MSIEEQIASINAQLATVRANLASHKAQQVANIARTADWLRNYRGPGHSAEADAALASCAADKVQIESQIASDNAQIDALTKQLDAAMKAADAQNAALADAASKGLTGDVALQRAKTRNMAIMAGIGIIALVVGLWAWKKYIRKK